MARALELPYFDDHHFPDARLEYEDHDGRLRHVGLDAACAPGCLNGCQLRQGRRRGVNAWLRVIE